MCWCWSSASWLLLQAACCGSQMLWRLQLEKGTFLAFWWLGACLCWVAVSRLIGVASAMLTHESAGRGELLPLWHKSSNAMHQERRGEKKKNRLKQPQTRLQSGFWLPKFCFSSLGMSQGSRQSSVSKDCLIHFIYLFCIICEMILVRRIHFST